MMTNNSVVDEYRKYYSPNNSLAKDWITYGQLSKIMPYRVTIPYNTGTVNKINQWCFEQFGHYFPMRNVTRQLFHIDNSLKYHIKDKITELEFLFRSEQPRTLFSLTWA